MIDTQNELIGLLMLASKLRVSAAWLKTETDAGRIPHLKAGRRTLYSLEAVRRTLILRAAGEAEGVKP